MKPVVVLRSHDACYLGILRGLAAAGAPRIPVVFDSEGADPWHSERSVHATAPHPIPGPWEDPERAVEELERLGEKLFAGHGERLLAVPSSNATLRFLLDHWDRFSSYFRVIGDQGFDDPRPEIVRKDRLAELFAARGIPAPATWRCARPGDLARAVEEAPLPCLYKPAVKDYDLSFLARHRGRRAVECSDRGALEKGLREELQRGQELVVQEKILFDSVFDEVPFFAYVDAHHEIRMAATGLKETIQPFPYGMATVLRLSWNQTLLPIARRVARALRWRGLLAIDFLRDRRDGQWKAVDVHGRPWLQIDFYRRCGLNFVGALAEDWSGRSGGWPALRVPGETLLDRNPVHLMLPEAFGGYAEGLDRPPGAADVAGFLRAIPGSRSLSFLDPGDPEPGRSELAALARRHDLDAEELERHVVAALGDD